MKSYSLRFGFGDPRTLTGLSPTFLIFARLDTGATLPPPAITELFSGTGLYTFLWGTTTPIAFLADAATISPGLVGRYVSGSLDPADRADEYGNTLIAFGLTQAALGVTLTVIVAGVGTVGSTFGGEMTDPIDLFGYLKRLQENLEGDNIFAKGTGVLSVLSRGSSTLLANKTVANNATMVTKTGH